MSGPLTFNLQYTYRPRYTGGRGDTRQSMSVRVSWPLRKCADQQIYVCKGDGSGPSGLVRRG